MRLLRLLTDRLCADRPLVSCTVTGASPSTDCTGRGRPAQYPVTVYRAHKADALFVDAKPIFQFADGQTDGQSGLTGASMHEQLAQ
jgi:hypothetical protein